MTQRRMPQGGTGPPLIDGSFPMSSWAEAIHAVNILSWPVPQAQGEEQTYWFPCEAWLDTLHGTHTTLRPAQGDPRRALVGYIATLHTGSEEGAGSSARVSLTIQGQHLKSGPHALEAPPGQQQPLTPAQVSFCRKFRIRFLADPRLYTVTNPMGQPCMLCRPALGCYLGTPSCILSLQAGVLMTLKMLASSISLPVPACESTYISLAVSYWSEDFPHALT